MRVDDTVNRAYRTTFGEYASKLDALQRLLESNSSTGNRLEAAIEDVEVARRAYQSARDVLACELGVKSALVAEAASR